VRQPLSGLLEQEPQELVVQEPQEEEEPQREVWEPEQEQEPETPTQPQPSPMQAGQLAPEA
jgi:hypothetical protein